MPLHDRSKVPETAPESAALASDELKRIQALSRRLQKWDRRRRWRVGAAALVVILGIVLVALVADLLLAGFLQNLLNAGNLPIVGFLLGVLLGVKVGFVLLGLGHLVAMLLGDPFRNERLLVKYYEYLLQQGPGARSAEAFPSSAAER